MQTATQTARGTSAAPYTVPFIVFLALLAIQQYIPLDQRVEFGLRIVVMAVILWVFSRHVITFRVTHPLTTVGIGITVFLVWIAPETLFANYRSHWLFNNSLVGTAKTSVSASGVNDSWLLLFRTLRATLIVPVVEELFWRAWLMRWLVDRDFWKVQLGTYLPSAFWLTAILFASEHGPYWDVGLLAGVIYNWWMIRTRSLGDLILAHAITNGCLCAYVILTHKWEYWL